MEQRNLIIIGGGPAGYVAAIRARQLGGEVTLIEQGTLGGVCLNRGCIPTRALARGVEFLDSAKKAKDYGINLEVGAIDFPKMMARKNTIVKTVVGGVELLMKENGVEVLRGRGKLLSPSEVEVQSEDGSSKSIRAQKVIVVTGSRWKKPNITGADRMITTDQALEFKEVPRSMLILGSGAIGLTFAAIYSKLGVSVTVIEGSAQLLPEFDKETVAVLEKELKKEKIRIHTEAHLKSITDGEKGDSSVTVSVKGQDTTFVSQYVLLAEGREANIDGIGLDNAGVKVSNGAVAVSKKMETSVANIFAAGDATGGHMLAHVAFAGGKVAAENAMGGKTEMDYTAVPRCVHTSPEIASIGLTEEEAVAQGYQIRIGRFPFAANGTATILGERAGKVKMISETKYGQILGVHIIGPHATELIQEAALAMKLDATPLEISSVMHTHPTVSEALMEAALDVTGETLHFVSANKPVK